jgi:serine/threonine-protein kinase RsbW
MDDKVELNLANQVSELEKLTGALEEVSERWGIPPKVLMHLNLALEELFTNVVFYGHQDEGQHDIHIEIGRNDHVLSVVVSDDAPEFNPFEHEDDSRVDKPLEERKIGGLGIHFVKTVMDSVDYARRDGKNIVTLTKRF